MRLVLTRSAREHKIGKAHMLYVMSHYTPIKGVRATGETELTWIGEDDRGVNLRVIGIPDAAD